MHQISVVGEMRARPEELARALADLFVIDFRPMPVALECAPKHHTLIDIDLNDDPQLLRLKQWLRRKPRGAKVVFVTDKTSRLQEVRAYGLGATAIIHHPIDGRTLLNKLWGDGATLATISGAPQGELTAGVAAATDALRNIFSAACSGAPVDVTAVQTASHAIVSQLEKQGLSAWIEAVRMHHSQTYQHCLLVTGLAVAFGEQIGASRKDRERLSFAGMLHDIGKARIPLAILEKPDHLDENEMSVMRKHPGYGLDALSTASALPAEMLDMVIHHHEYLDGSGYPHTGCKGAKFPIWSA
jgi:putative nucleotidyltransferase with HDIG domain